MKSKRKIRVGFVGAGHIAEFHARAVQSVPFCELLAVHDANQVVAESFSKRFGIPKTYRNIQEMCESEQLDVVHVLTPPSIHVANALEALESNCHVLIEKPFATSVADCVRIKDAATKAHRQVSVDHSLLFDPFVKKALRIIERGKIGNVVAVDHIRSQFYPPYQGGALPEHFRNGGNPFRDVGVHSIYLIERILGNIQSADVKLGDLNNDGNPRVKNWMVSLSCPSGLARIFLSWTLNPLQNILIIYGTSGMVVCDIFGMSVTTRRTYPMPGQLNRLTSNAAQGMSTVFQVPVNFVKAAVGAIKRYHGLRAFVREFYQAIDQGTPVPVSTESAESATEWTELVAAFGDKAKSDFEGKFARSGNAEILVTGATGFIGKDLVARLLDTGKRIRILVRREPQANLLHNPGVEVFLGDLGNAQDVDRAFQGISTVIHLGATVDGYREEFQCATITGTRNVIASCKKHAVRKLIYVSSMSVFHFAKATRQTPIDESFPYEPHPQRRGLYTQSKLEAELLVRDAVRDEGLPAIILRPGEVIGRSKLFLSGAVGKVIAKRVWILGRGSYPIPLIWLDDLIDALLAAANIDLPAGTSINLVDPEIVSQEQFARAYLSAKGWAPKLLRMPLFLLTPISFLAQSGLRLLGKSSPITPYKIASAVGEKRFDITLAKKLLGWIPKVGVRDGLCEMGSAEH